MEGLRLYARVTFLLCAVVLPTIREWVSLRFRNSSMRRALLRNLRLNGSELRPQLERVVSIRLAGLFSSKVSRVTAGGRRQAIYRSGEDTWPLRGDCSVPPRITHWLDLNGELEQRRGKGRSLAGKERSSPVLVTFDSNKPSWFVVHASGPNADNGKAVDITDVARLSETLR
jgi:hypothetical protein